MFCRGRKNEERENKEIMFKTQKGKELYIEVLRIAAILLVIFNHTDGYFLYYSNTENPLTWWFSFVGSALCRVNVPLFIMITGALLLEKEESVRTLYKKRVLRIGIVLAVFSFFYYTLNVFRNAQNEFSFIDFLKGLLSGSIQESFWYLYLYLGLLLLLPLLRRMARGCRDGELRYLLILQIVLGTGAGGFSFLTETGINNNLYLLNIYIFYLLAGYYLGRRVDMERVPKRWVIIVFVANVLCLFGTYLIVRLDYIRNGIYSQDMLNLFTPVLTMGIFFCVKWLCYRYDVSKNLKKLICEAGGCVFGIYLLEQLARIQLLPLYLFLSEKTFGVLACTCYVVCSFALAWLYTELLKRVPLLRSVL